MRRRGAIALAAALLLACAGPRGIESPYPLVEHAPADPEPPPGPPAGPLPVAARPAAWAGPPGRAGAPPLVLDGTRSRLDLPAGRSIVAVALPGSCLVTVGLLGPAGALLAFDVRPPADLAGLGQLRALDEDGLLPRFVSLRTSEQQTSLAVVVDAAAPVVVVRFAADPGDIAAPSPRALAVGELLARPLIGLPAPLDPGAGYVSQAPSRYQFLRSDVAVALLGALRQTRTRFRRDPLAIGDASQWDGGRPASDLGTTRHISHLGGRDVDVALASDDPEAPSLFVRHCQGVRTELDVFQCAPGTVHGFDALRMAYFLGLLVDGPTPNGIHMPEGRPGPIAEVETIYTDQAYIDEVGRAAQVLRERRWIHDDGYAALGEDGIMRPSPWHTDHVHVRFGGEAARAPLTPAPGSSP